MKEEINKNTIISTRDPLLRKAIHEAYFGICFYTGRNVDFNEMCIDHVIPKAKGGSDCISNYVLSCEYINKIKCANEHK